MRFPLNKGVVSSDHLDLLMTEGQQGKGSLDGDRSLNLIIRRSWGCCPWWGKQEPRGLARASSLFQPGWEQMGRHSAWWEVRYSQPGTKQLVPARDSAISVGVSFWQVDQHKEYQPFFIHFSSIIRI